MKTILLLVTISVITACSTIKQSSVPLGENDFFIVRKYVGNYLDYRHTGMEDYTGTNLIWIKTSMENTFGKISAYAKKCEFAVGDRLYLKRSYYTPGGLSGYWVYYIENDSSLFYKVTEFQNDKKVLVQTWFD